MTIISTIFSFVTVNHAQDLMCLKFEALLMNKLHPNFQFLMVTGGGDLSGRIDSTEIFSDNVWRTVAAKLPRTIKNFRMATINNRVLVFGN